MSHSTMTSSLFDRVARNLPGVGDWETFAIYVGPLIKNAGKCHELSDVDTQELVQTTLIRIWDGIKAGDFRAPREHFSYWVVSCAKSAATDLVRQWRDDQEFHGSDGSFLNWCQRRVPAPEIRVDFALDELPSEELMKAVAANLTAFVRERHEDAAQLARDCVLTYLQRAPESSQRPSSRI